MNDTCDPWQIPEHPFDYAKLIRHPDGIGHIPEKKQGAKIAVIGAGCAGLCAAYELMKTGLHPVIYESAKHPDGTPRIGGRCYTYRFPGDPEAFAELGAMRFPPVHRLLTTYMDRFGIDYSRPFPDPLVVPTVLWFEGKKHFIPVGGPLPPEIRKASDAWRRLAAPLANQMIRVWNTPALREKQWKTFAEQYADKSFYQVLREQGLSRKEIRYFGSLGLGTGGFDSLFPISFLEILRIVVCKWEVGQRLIRGGTDQIPLGFWKRPRYCRHGGRQSVSLLNKDTLRPAVREIYTPCDPAEPVLITDDTGKREPYDAVIVTCSLRALETGIRVNRRTFSDPVWTALQNIHMVSSGKVFVRTRTAFWKKQPPESTLNCTITDEITRGTYLFDFENTPSGVICLSYTWEDASLKLSGPDADARVSKSLEVLARIYGKDLISREVAEAVSFSWENADGYNGAFKLTYPGQYEYQKILCRQPLSPEPESRNGVFLAGDSVSWAGGWVEGALQSGLNAAMGVIRKIGGRVHSD
ncbi:amine oxidase [Desulfonema ishimotonii]|uniref:Tryptophan 2-monooxygenase n=1 Tax=Desulfonema ishimotonii TaxID=45657 RepID=A0A401FQY9_9BACT|nr:NAD(P)/FAD-dependent oxidoreductase [Desulfonema ishimotonii]GBC59388.1 amine oxidase [Desulfonema ishimotonii]